MSTYYTKDHEYIRIEADHAIVGISDYAQAQLGDVVFVELPAVGQSFGAGDQVAVVESVKAASEVYAPASGQVSAINDALEANPGLVNEAPQGAGWFFKMTLSDTNQLASLMDEAAYQAFVASLG
ncbi:MAG: glycine cleavage system protein GcvH [Alphaproteobacteria bacterium]|nr:glycine cleavage system protein GcvH [Alphaproteobacteria bacterium]